MRRSFFRAVFFLLLGILLGGGAYWAAVRLSSVQLMRGADDLAWLQREFRLSDAELDRVRELHDGYLPQCQAMCDRIMAVREGLDRTLAATNHLSAAAREQLDAVNALRAQCQAQMLEHFYEVSRAMPPGQGERYLAEMRRLTLGLHERIEQNMSGSSSHGHH